MTPEEAAYLAGLIDGEGSIQIFNNKASQGVTMVVTVANNHVGVLQWCKAHCGGYVTDVSSKLTDQKNWKRQYRWQVAAKKAEEVVKICLPYMIIKKAQAELFLEYRNLIVDMGKQGRRGIPIENKAKREIIVSKMKILNRRGKPLLELPA